MRFFKPQLVIATFTTVIAISISLCAQDQKSGHQKSGDATDIIANSTNHLNSKQTYHLQYKLKKGDTVRFEVEQIATTKTSIAGQSEESSVRSRSTTAWKVINVDSLGNMTFQHSIESVNMWQQVGDQEPISYDSLNDEEIPDVYRRTAESIGIPLATITIDPAGGVVNRNTDDPETEFGMGTIAIPLPKEPVKLGFQWAVPDQLTARHKDGRIKQIKTRMLFTLRSVKDNLATVGFRREVLTPIEDPKIRSQIMQHMNNGVIVFDLAAGHEIEKHVDWSEKVQGFEGPDSYLEYLGSYTKKFVTGERKASTETPAQNRTSLIIKPRDGKPIIRH